MEILGLLSLATFILFLISLFKPSADFFDKLPVLKDKGTFARRLLCFGLWGGIFVLGTIFVPKDDTDAQTSEQTKNEVQNTVPKADTIPDIDSVKALNTTKPYIHKKLWKTSSSVDEMTDDVNIWKTITSDNRVYFDFPYKGGSSLDISVRYMKKYGGNDVILTISKGQILCHDHDKTSTISVRFDDGPVQKFKCDGPDDGDSDCIFIREANRFIKFAKNAHTIKIELTFFQEGKRIFTFNVDEPLEWDK